MIKTKKPIKSSFAKIILAVLVIISAGVAMGTASYLIKNESAPIDVPKIQTSPLPKQAVNPVSENKEAKDETADWKIYRNEKYGFELRYPAGFSVFAEGPNVAQKNLDAGKTISGTVTPSYETLVFENESRIKKFEISVFHKTEKDLTEENYQNFFYVFGACDLRYLSSSPTVSMIQRNGIPMIYAAFMDKKAPSQSRSCYYFKNINSNLIVLSLSEPENKSDYENTNRIVQRLLSTLKFAQKEEISEWETYRNYGLEFKYPKNWGDLELASQKNSALYFFKAENEKIQKVLYHNTSGKIAFIESGEKQKLVYGDKKNYRETLKIISGERIKTVYDISLEKTRWGGKITNVVFSPDGKYISFFEKAYESFQPIMIDIEKGENIFSDKNIWFSDYHKSVFWSRDNKTLAIKSEINQFSGQGIEGIFASDYGNPNNLNEVFSISEKEYTQGKRIGGVSFVDDKEIFLNVLEKEKTVEKYVYNIKTKKLREEKLSDWKVYRNEEYGFELRYQEELTFKRGDHPDFPTGNFLNHPVDKIKRWGTKAVAVSILFPNIYPDTNFEGAWLTVSYDPDISNLQRCQELERNEMVEKMTENEIINNIIWYKGITGGAGLGSAVSETVYHTFHNNICYEIVLHIKTFDLENLDQSVKNVKPFNENKIWNEFKGILSAFKFVK